MKLVSKMIITVRPTFELCSIHLKSLHWRKTLRPLELKIQIHSKRVVLLVSPQEKHTDYVMKLVSKAFWPTFQLAICKYIGVNSPLCQMFTEVQAVPVANGMSAPSGVTQ